MNIFAFILGLVPSIVKGLQTVLGDKVSGATKSQMAQDALNQAVTAVVPELAGNNQIFGVIAGGIAQAAINTTVAISKANGQYAKWTAAATAAQSDAQTASVIGQLLNQIHQSQDQAPAAPPAPSLPASSVVVGAGTPAV